MDVPLGCDSLVHLACAEVPSFKFPNSIIILDGDVKTKKPKELSRIKKLNNVLLLPTDKSPEQFISQFLYDLNDISPLWEEIDKTFSHQVCFKKYKNE